MRNFEFCFAEWKWVSISPTPPKLGPYRRRFCSAATWKFRNSVLSTFAARFRLRNNAEKIKLEIDAVWNSNYRANYAAKMFHSESHKLYGIQIRPAYFFIHFPSTVPRSWISGFNLFFSCLSAGWHSAKFCYYVGQRIRRKLFRLFREMRGGGLESTESVKLGFFSPAVPLWNFYHFNLLEIKR